MRPVHEPSLLVVLVDPSEPDLVTDSERHPPCEIEVVGDQQRLVADLDDEALVALSVVVVRQQANNPAGVLDPLAVVAFAVSQRSARRHRHHRDLDATVCRASRVAGVVGDRAQLAHADLDDALRVDAVGAEILGDRRCSALR